jgi:hypothetical protein
MWRYVKRLCVVCMLESFHAEENNPSRSCVFFLNYSYYEHIIWKNKSYLRSALGWVP